MGNEKSSRSGHFEDGQPVAWRYPRTVSDIDPYVVTLRRKRKKHRSRSRLGYLPNQERNHHLQTLDKQEKSSATKRYEDNMLLTPFDSTSDRSTPEKRSVQHRHSQFNKHHQQCSCSNCTLSSGTSQKLNLKIQKLKCEIDVLKRSLEDPGRNSSIQQNQRSSR